MSPISRLGSDAKAPISEEFGRVARDWLAEDPDPDTRAELAALLASDDGDAVADRFGGRLQFGTAGLRGQLGAGPNRMNVVLVRRVAAGLAAYLGPGTRVVIGYDARHKSDLFAADSAAVLRAAGIEALLFPRPLPTPLLAFAVRHMRCDAGIMVTASHNPARDNGYKIYLGDGAQLIPPADAEISAAIDAVGPLATIALDANYAVLGDGIIDAYLDAITGRYTGARRQLRIVYTPLHGVGGELALAALARAGFTDVHVVAAQAEPDPDFPTVAFPNPEEPGALDLALIDAERLDADIVIANDPDADRLAVAVTVGQRQLTGDEVGCLLAHHLLSSRPATQTAVGDDLDRFVHPARAHRRRLRRPLRAHPDRIQVDRAAGAGPPDWEFVLGYEEALGYCVDGAVNDKDGISAALAIADLTAVLQSRGLTLLDRLAEFDHAYGRYRTGQRSFRMDPASQEAVMGRVRAQPGAHDLRPLADVVVLELAGGHVTFRPSGTEPKLELYAEVVDGDLEQVLAEAVATAALQ